MSNKFGWRESKLLLFIRFLSPLGKATLSRKSERGAQGCHMSHFAHRLFNFFIVLHVSIPQANVYKNSLAFFDTIFQLPLTKTTLPGKKMIELRCQNRGGGRS